MAEKPMNGGLLALIISVPVVLIILFVVLPNRDEAPSSTNNGGTATVIDENGNPIDVNNAKNFAFMKPTDWYRYDNANEDIQSLGEGQSIVFGVVEDPTDDNIVYFASYTFDESTKEILWSIYKYQQDDYTFERIYKTTLSDGYAAIPALVNPAVRVIGYDSGHLVLLVQDVQDTGGPCANALLHTNDEYHGVYTLDLASPYSGFEEYEIPEDVVEQAQAEYDTCIDETF